jgi:hypothetical protein
MKDHKIKEDSSIADELRGIGGQRVLPEQCGRQVPAQAGALVDLLEAQVLEPGFFGVRVGGIPSQCEAGLIFTHRGQRSDAVALAGLPSGSATGRHA